MNTRYFPGGVLIVHRRNCIVQIESEDNGVAGYRVHEFVEDAFNVQVTPFMLDGYFHEYQEMVRKKEAQAIEIEGLRTSNRMLSSQV